MTSDLRVCGKSKIYRETGSAFDTTDIQKIKVGQVVQYTL